MYELTVMLITFFTVVLSCWWIGDDDELALTEPTTTPLPPTPRRLIQEQAALGD